MDDITGKWANLSLNSKESHTVDLVTPDTNNTNNNTNNRVLVAKFFTKRRPNMDAITQTLRSMWRSGGNFEIRELGANIVLILFDDETDVNRILLQGPWTFDKYLIGLFKLGEEASVEDARFDKASFWVQIHGLQLRCMRKENVEAIGKTLGIVEDIDVSATGDCKGKCIRVPINIDITQPLCRGRMVNIGGPQP